MAIPWWAWMVLAGVLGLAEMHFPGSYLGWLALGALLTGIADVAFGLSLEGQIGMFAAASALSCAAGYIVYSRLGRVRPAAGLLNRRALAMVGMRGTVCEALRNGTGKVRLGDSVWLAEGPDLAVGAPVVVSAVSGTRVVVAALEPAAASAGPIPRL
jgi:membrane protein implicated in regulation of membrane protease activity